MKKYILLLFILGSSFISFAQMQSWAVAFGGPPIEEAFSIVQSKDGGFVIGGTLYNILPQYNNMYVAKVDSNGNLLWANNIGDDTIAFHNSHSSYGNSISGTNDGGYILAGGTSQYGAGNEDVYIVKLNSAGSLQWTKTIGGIDDDYGYSVVQTKDRGYAIAGQTTSFGGGNADVYVTKLDSLGNMLWSKTIGGPDNEVGQSIIQTKDGGYAITGYTDSYGAGNYDVYIIKLDSTGNLNWTKTIGGRNRDWGNCIVQCKDGGYAITGFTYSYNDTIDGDVYIIRLDSIGNVIWTRTIGDTTTISNPIVGEDVGQSIIQTNDGDFAVVGYTSSYGGGMYDDIYFIKLDSIGNLKRTHTYGGIQGAFGESIIQTKSGGFVIGGYTSIYRGGYEDVFILLLDSAGNNCDTTGSGGIVDSGGTISSGGIITSSDSGRINFGGSSTSHGIIVGSCGVITSSNDVKPASANFEIYPNPCTNTLNINFETQSNLSEIQIMDITGRVLLTYDLSVTAYDFPVNVSSLSTGMYFIRINRSSGTEVRKFIKE